MHPCTSWIPAGLKGLLGKTEKAWALRRTSAGFSLGDFLHSLRLHVRRVLHFSHIGRVTIICFISGFSIRRLCPHPFCRYKWAAFDATDFGNIEVGSKETSRIPDGCRFGWMIVLLDKLGSRLLPFQKRTSGRLCPLLTNFWAELCLPVLVNIWFLCLWEGILGHLCTPRSVSFLPPSCAWNHSP